MTNAIENIKKAREIISRDLLKGSDDYKTALKRLIEEILRDYPNVDKYIEVCIQCRNQMKMLEEENE